MMSLHNLFALHVFSIISYIQVQECVKTWQLKVMVLSLLVITINFENMCKGIMHYIQKENDDMTIDVAQQKCNNNK